MDLMRVEGVRWCSAFGAPRGCRMAAFGHSQGSMRTSAGRAPPRTAHAAHKFVRVELFRLGPQSCEFHRTAPTFRTLPVTRRATPMLILDTAAATLTARPIDCSGRNYATES